MNKKNKILVGCLALLLVLSVGYALFSEQVTINGTATAKGSFDLTTTCVSGLDSDYASMVKEEYGYENYEGGYENSECTVNDNKVTFGVNLLYPSAQKYFTIYVKNTGTIAAQLDGKNDQVVTYETCIDNDRDGVAESCVDNPVFMVLEHLGTIKTDGTKVPVNSSDFAEFNDASTGVITIKPNETIVAMGVARWKDSYDYGSFNNTLMHTTVTATFDFKQVTN